MLELSKSEEHVMITIWLSSEPPTMKSVRADVNSRFNHEWVPQTISTFLSRLYKKGYVTKGEERSFRFLLSSYKYGKVSKREISRTFE